MKSSLPIDALPEKMRDFVLTQSLCDGFKPDYLISAMLSAAATAIGTTQSICIRNNWSVYPSLFIALVGRPGSGKTPPINIAYEPLRKYDARQLENYRRERVQWEGRMAQKTVDGEPIGARPMLKKLLLNDVTPEAALMQHSLNPRGVAINVDELVGFLISLNKNNNTQFLEQLMSAWSGEAIDVSRKTSDDIIHIERPCFNLVGSIQTDRLGQLVNRGNNDSGFLDRMLFCSPFVQDVGYWEDGADQQKLAEHSVQQRYLWHKALVRLVQTQPQKEARVLSMGARKMFSNWWNRIVKEINEGAKDNIPASREMKYTIMAARLALVLQCIKDAYDGREPSPLIQDEAMSGALQLLEAYEDTFSRIMGDMLMMRAAGVNFSPAMRKWFDELPDNFGCADVERNVAETTGKRYLRAYIKAGLIEQISRGKYAKTMKK